jgi:hypothetical protein
MYKYNIYIMHTFKYMYTYITHTHAHTQPHTHILTCVLYDYVCMYAYVYIYIYITCTHTTTCTHTHTHANMHMCDRRGQAESTGGLTALDGVPRRLTTMKTLIRATGTANVSVYPIQTLIKFVLTKLP